MAQKHRLQIILAPVLLPFSWLFAVISRMRFFLYKHGILKTYTPKIPCICVGIISWGGTGKSPLIDYLLKRFHKEHIDCAVLSRGYGVKLPHYPFVLDKNSVMNDSRLPDEPCMLFNKNPFTTIIINPKRAESALYAEKNLPHIQALLMDDGFQHFALNRTENFVLLDKDDLTPKAEYAKSNWNTLIPLGSWREPEQALHRASAFFLKCPPSAWEQIKQHCLVKLAPYHKPLFVFNLNIERLEPLFHKEIKPIRQYALIAGIGNPYQFQESVQNFLGQVCAKSIFLTDHADMEKHAAKLLALDMPVICTEKDAVKLKRHPELARKEIYCTATAVQFHACAFTPHTFETWFAENILTHFNNGN